MQKFPYLSPVRFYPDESYLTDMKNPENTIFWGKRADFHFLNAYPLEINMIHRFPVPMNWDDVTGISDLKLFLKSGNSEIPVLAIFNIHNNKISCISFKCTEFLCGRLIVKQNNTTILISNEVKFTDSNDGLGRKHITLSSRHSYDINRFPFEDQNCWFHTSIPAFCLGQTSIALELQHNRIGGVSSKKIKDTYSDYETTYEIESDCDSNILNFVENAGRNNLFFIDGIQRTIDEKVNRAEKNVTGVLKVVNVLDKDGNNITLDSTNIFENLTPYLKKIAYNIEPSPNEVYVPITQNGQLLDFNSLTSAGMNFKLTFNDLVKVKQGVTNLGAVYKNGVLESYLNCTTATSSLDIVTDFISLANFVSGDTLSVEIFPDVFENNLLILNASQSASIPKSLHFETLVVGAEITWTDGTKILRSVRSDDNLAILNLGAGQGVYWYSVSQYSTDGVNWNQGNTMIDPGLPFLTLINTPGWYYLRVEITDIYNNKTYTNVLREYVYDNNTPECKYHGIDVGGLQPTDLLEIEYFDCTQPQQGSTHYGVYQTFSELVSDIQVNPVSFCAFNGTPVIRLNGVVDTNLVSFFFDCASFDYNPVQVIPANYSSPIDPNIVGNSICFTGNQWTKQVKLSGHPSTNPFIYLMDGITPAIPGNLTDFDTGGATGFNLNGIRWIRFTALPTGNNIIYDVNPATGQITGVSQTYNCI